MGRQSLGRHHVDGRLDEDQIEPLFVWSLIGCVAAGLAIWGVIITLLV